MKKIAHFVFLFILVSSAAISLLACGSSSSTTAGTSVTTEISNLSIPSTISTSFRQ